MTRDNDQALITQDNVEDDIVYGEQQDPTPEEQRRIEERIFDMNDSDQKNYDKDPALIAFNHGLDIQRPREHMTVGYSERIDHMYNPGINIDRNNRIDEEFTLRDYDFDADTESERMTEDEEDSTSNGQYCFFSTRRGHIPIQLREYRVARATVLTSR